jgi:hypothetical protein
LLFETSFNGLTITVSFAASLKPHDVDLERNLFHIGMAKGSSYRTVPISYSLKNVSDLHRGSCYHPWAVRIEKPGWKEDAVDGTNDECGWFVAVFCGDSLSSEKSLSRLDKDEGSFVH